MTPKLKLREAAEIILQDFLKDGTKALISFLFKGMFNLHGASFIFALLVLLLGFMHWLAIPITIPMFLVLAVAVVPIVAYISFRRIDRKLKSRRSNGVVLDGLLFTLGEECKILGPLCTRCEGKMITVYDQNYNLTKVIFGQEAEYIYACTCGHQIISNKSQSELLRVASGNLQRDKTTN